MNAMFYLNRLPMADASHIHTTYLFNLTHSKNVKNIAIGPIIREELRRQGRTNLWLAERINVNPRTVNKIFQKVSIDSQQLMLISCALGVDFFQYYSRVFAEKMELSTTDAE